MSFNQKQALKLLQALEGGLSLEDACIFAECTQANVSDWMDIEPSFQGKVEQAKIFMKKQSLQTLKKTSVDSADDAKWWLERRYPQEYAKTVRQEMSGKDGQSLFGELEAAVRLLASKPPPDDENAV